ncbi:uncharacterized protein EAF02_003946 [Botrytis sinoallii]|uniref:uncharacterized protein n=1 Tax=Botrytis sinoallii TaxID=1463999 RepID=UPI0018FF9414|nr:uncharacterized protein EAF02_003946 [Botrytis sinoallii]KAF7885437.1 hypothetical protein EAF02_003946 [Botrytis sinoallii]
MSSSKGETPEARIARLVKYDNVIAYNTYCKKVKDNEKRPEVVRYWKAVKTYKASEAKEEVVDFVKARGRKASKEVLDKMREGKYVKEFEEAGKTMNKLADEEHVKTHREAKETKKRMEEKNLEVVQYIMARQSLESNKETNEAKKSLLQPSGSSTGSTRNSSNGSDGNGRQTRKAEEELKFPKKAWGKGPPKPEDFFDNLLPAADKGPRKTRREGSRDRSAPQTDSKSSASAPKEIEPKRNSGKNRRASPHTDMERNMGKKGQ